MSASSDVLITREEAEKRVESVLMSTHTVLVYQAIKGMTEEELASYLHSEYYFYHVEKKKRGKK